MPPLAPSGGLSSSPEASAAALEGTKGAAIGALKYSIPLSTASLLAYNFYPPYRSLTIPFRVFLVMSGAVLGGMIEAERWVHRYEKRVSLERRMVARGERERLRREEGDG
ncbi:MAG: hypothetical protein MMC33_001121 [Icmadophila ericetorum]|nr:hypothetical protein [Icmadophila ericetorum]